MTPNSKIRNKNMVLRVQRSISHWGVFVFTYFLNETPEDFIGENWKIKFVRPLNFNEEIDL